MTSNRENLKFFNKSSLCFTLAVILTLASFSVGCSKTKVEKKAESLSNTNSTYEDKKSTTEAAPTTTEQNNNSNPSTDSSESIVNTSKSNAESNTNLNKTTSSNSNTQNTSGISKTNGNSSAPSSSGTSSAPASNPSPAAQPTPVNYIYGNTTGNLTNSGIAVFDGQYIYFNGSTNGTGTYKINPNDATSTKVSSESGYSYNVVGDWIFYCNFYPADSKGIFKIKKDGTGYTKLSTDTPVSACISVVNDWIYYIAMDSNKNTPMLWKIKTDGTNKSYIDVTSNNTLVFTDYYKVISYNGWLFITLFNTTDHKTSLYKIKPDGSNITKVIDGAKDHFSIEGNNIYYLSSNYREIWRCDLDGTAKTMIYSTPSSDFCIYSLNVSGSYIYFSADNQSASVSNQGIYKIKTDGSGFTKLTNICTKFITIVSDWIFFDGSTDNTHGIMTIKTDGSKVSISN